MPLWILITLSCFAATWRWPLAGYAIFLASATPLVNLMGGIIHPSGPILCYFLATMLILWKKMGRKKGIPLDWTEIACIALTIVVLFRQIEMASLRGSTFYIQPILYASLWAPFLLVVRRLSDEEMKTLRYIAILGLFVIGIFPMLGYLTGSEQILEVSRPMFSPEQMIAGKMSDFGIQYSRQITVGAFNYLPYAYWILLYAIFSRLYYNKINIFIHITSQIFQNIHFL